MYDLANFLKYFTGDLSSKDAHHATTGVENGVRQLTGIL